MVKTCEAGSKSAETKKLFKTIPKGFLDRAFPEKIKQRFLCSLPKATEI